MIEKKASTVSPLSTVNPRISEIRVEGGEGDNRSLTILMIGRGQGTYKEDGNAIG